MSVRIFATAWFHRFARKEHISDLALLDAVERAESGLVDAELGGGVIKQRVARQGKGRSGGFRVLIYYRVGARAVFAYGFAKNRLENIEPERLREFKEAAHVFLNLSDKDIDILVDMRKMVEVMRDG
jgi:hypothetical protein